MLSEVEVIVALSAYSCRRKISHELIARFLKASGMNLLFQPSGASQLLLSAQALLTSSK